MSIYQPTSSLHLRLLACTSPATSLPGLAANFTSIHIDFDSTSVTCHYDNTDSLSEQNIKPTKMKLSKPKVLILGSDLDYVEKAYYDRFKNDYEVHVS